MKHCKLNFKLQKYSKILGFSIIIFILQLGAIFESCLNAQPLSYYIIQVPSAVGKTNNLNTNKIQNPAQNNLQKRSIEINLIPNVFNLDELNVNSISYISQIDSSLSSQFSFTNMGSDIYNHFGITSNWALRFNKYTVGVGVEFDRMSVKNFNQYYYFGFNMGVIYDIDNNYQVGLVISNLNRDFFGDSKNNVPQRLILGFGGELTDKFFIDLDIQINIQNNTSFSVSNLYEYADGYAIGLAFNTKPQILELRNKFQILDRMNLNINLSRRVELGFFTNFSLSYNFD